MTPRVQGMFLQPKYYEAGVWTSHQADEEQTCCQHSLAVSYLSSHVRRPHCNYTHTSEIHKGLDDVLPVNIKGKWNQLVPYTGLFSGKGTNTQKQRIRNFSDDNHTLVIISSLCGSTCYGHKDPDPRSSIR